MAQDTLKMPNGMTVPLVDVTINMIDMEDETDLTGIIVLKPMTASARTTILEKIDEDWIVEAGYDEFAVASKRFPAVKKALQAEGLFLNIF